MKKIGTIVTNLLEDRGVKKIRVNVVREDRIFGFLRPID